MPKQPPVVLDLDGVFYDVRHMLVDRMPGVAGEQIDRIMGLLINEIVTPFEVGKDSDKPVFVSFEDRIVARLEHANEADAGLRVFEIEETPRGDVMREVTPKKTTRKKDRS